MHVHGVTKWCSAAACEEQRWRSLDEEPAVEWIVIVSPTLS